MFNALKKLFNGPEPIHEEAIEWAHQNELTPDLWRLEQFVRQRIFVPCDMKRGGKNHEIIESAVNGPIFLDVYTARDYTLWKKDLGSHSFPVALPGDYKPDAFTIVPVEAAPIKGELYHINPLQFVKLDKLRHPSMFYRERVPIRIPYRTVKYRFGGEGTTDKFPTISNHNYFVTVDAWMYFGIEEYWDPMIGGIFKSQMDLYEHDQPRQWMKHFYKFETG
jgi:hypothetical protein